MKVSIITFFDNGNYGSELQSLALSRYISNKGNDVILCHIKANNKLIRILEMICDKVSLSFLTVFNKEIKEFLHDRTINSSKQRSISLDLKQKIHSFVSQNTESQRVSRWNIPNKQFDVYICGSDQIWSALKLPIFPKLFLSKVSPERKIAYAPSIGLDRLPNYYIKQVKKYVSDFKYISVRENTARQAFKEYMGVDAVQTLDPTMLVGVDFWDKILCDKGKKTINKEYIFCYFLGEIPQYVINSINELSNKKEVYILPYEEDSLKILNGKFYLADPLDFVNLIKNATYILTDSFHGTVFSILYKKQFAVIRRSHVGIVAQTSRITSLLSLFSLENQYCKDSKGIRNALLTQIDYNSKENILYNEQIKSRFFLDNALNEIKDNLEK